MRRTKRKQQKHYLRVARDILAFLIGMMVGVVLVAATSTEVPRAEREALEVCKRTYGERCYLEYNGDNWELLIAPEEK